MECYCGEIHAGTFAGALETLARTPDLLAEAVQHLAGPRRGDRPTAGKWTIPEIVGHMKNFELIASVHYRLLLTEDVPDLPPFDPRRWLDRFGYDRTNLPATVHLFHLLRADNIRLLRSLPDQDLRHEGWHPEHGSITLEAMAIHIAAHDSDRLEQIRKWESSPDAQG